MDYVLLIFLIPGDQRLADIFINNSLGNRSSRYISV